MENKETKTKEQKFCPQCGSIDIYYVSGLPQIWSIWECRRCGYRGPAVVEDVELAKKVSEDWEKAHPKGE
jgi:predicted RNA-binding Zn-ribbon protein involved in translation (DUF1610 family)